ncbi:metalloprotease family protein [Clostridium tertium]|uniref:metalloprotease family protein n=1 Tax=Clostridium tertium TaxID=1559 RepID=UPI00241FE9C9|nr:metalloprotease family protein [Clostridium tertium]
MQILKISILKSSNNKNNDFIDEHNNGHIVKEDFSSLILFIKVIIASIYAFGLGYSLFYSGDDFLKVGIKFLLILIVLYFLMEFPYALLKASLLPNAFNKDIIKLNLNPYNMSISISSRKPISKNRVLIASIVPFIILALAPTVISYILEFNIYLYAIASASAIISMSDLIFSIILISNESVGESLIITPYEYIDSNISLKETSLDLDKDDKLECKDEFCYQLLENIDKSKIKSSLIERNKDPEYIKEMIFNVDDSNE